MDTSQVLCISSRMRYLPMMPSQRNLISSQQCDLLGGWGGWDIEIKRDMNSNLISSSYQLWEVT